MSVIYIFICCCIIYVFTHVVEEHAYEENKIWLCSVGFLLCVNMCGITSLEAFPARERPGCSPRNTGVMLLVQYVAHCE